MKWQWCTKGMVHRWLAGVLLRLKVERQARHPLWFRLASSALAFIATFSCIVFIWARLDHSEASAEPTIAEASIVTLAAGPGAPPDNSSAPSGMTSDIAVPLSAGKLVATQDAVPRLAIASPTDADIAAEYEIGANTRILLNGSPVRLSALKSGDDIKVVATDGAVATVVEATRSKSGILLNAGNGQFGFTTDYLDKFPVRPADGAKITLNGKPALLTDLHVGDAVNLIPNNKGQATSIAVTRRPLLEQFWENFRKNLFKPLLLFFYMGFLIPLLRIAFEFPRAVYQGLTIYLLVAIGWHGGEELSVLSGSVLNQALGFLVVGFTANFIFGVAAYWILRTFVPKMRQIDSATVAAYYGSDSAGTFVTCVGVLQVAHIAFAAYMPVMLAVMEVPGCLVGLYLVSRLRKTGMDKKGNMPGEPGYMPPKPVETQSVSAEPGAEAPQPPVKVSHLSSAKLLREVFLNPGLILLFGGIIIGYVSRLQGVKVVEADDKFFVSLFQGILCLFLLEMGMTASRHLRDLTTASWRFVAFGLLAPNLFAITGMVAALIFSHAIHMPFQLGTYVLFGVLCGAASYIAVPAIQRIAIPEASPTLPLAASLGLTFSYNVTIGIPVYLVVAQNLLNTFPVPGT